MSQAPKKRRRGTWRALHPSPLAFALDGAVIASVALVDDVHDAESTIRAAVEHGGRVYVGIVLDEREIQEVRKWLFDAAYESLAFALGARRKRSRRKKRKARADA